MPPESTGCVATSTRWDGGWYTQAFSLHSPNYGPRPAGAKIDLAVIHSISLPPSQYGTAQVHALFCNVIDWNAHPYYETIRGLRVSSHFLITRNGSLWQFVDCDARAWHAGSSHYRGRENCNDDSIGIELEGIEGGPFEEAQYACLLPLLNDLRQRYPLAYVAGHEHIAPGRKQDPGAGFDWPRLVPWAVPNGVSLPAS